MMKRPTACILAVLCLTLTASAQRREIALPDVPGYHTLKCDFHIHTDFSDGSVWPTVRVEEAWSEGLDVIAITDHIEYLPKREDITTTDLNRPSELAAEISRQRNMLLVRGAEITRDTPPGHFNAIFLQDVNPLNTKEFFDVFERAAEQKAFVFWNHPCWQGRERGLWGPAQTTLFEKKQMHGIEICNDTLYDPDAHREALERRLTLLGNSDIHGLSPDATRTFDNHRTLTLVFARERTLAGVREALGAARTAVWYANQLIGRPEQLAPLYEACVRVGRVHHRAKDAAWVHIANASELKLELKRDGVAGPDRITIDPRSTTLVRFPAAAIEMKEGLPYRAVNFVVAPGESLPVRLRIEAPESRPSP